MELSERLDWNCKLREPFKKISFIEDTHTYSIAGDDRKIKSVSSLLKYFYDEFDSEGVSVGYASSRGFKQSDVLKAWEGEGTIATTHGSKVHLYGEDYLNWYWLGIGEEPEVFDKQSLGVQDFFNNLPDYLIPVASELQMYSPKYWYCGTTDLVFFNKKAGKIYLGDFKTNNSLTSKYDKTPLKIIDQSHGLLQNNLGKYCLQLNFYRLLLEEQGFKVQGSVIVHLKEDQKNKKLYCTHKVPDLRQELIEWLETGEHLN